jgi:hypothetical protein
MQNALLVALLQEAGVPARMAIGFVGQDGRTNSWLHAWAEYRDGDGPWQIADASASASPLALVGPANTPAFGDRPPRARRLHRRATPPVPGDSQDEDPTTAPAPAADPEQLPRALDPAAPPPVPSNMSQAPAHPRRRWTRRCGCGSVGWRC